MSLKLSKLYTPLLAILSSVVMMVVSMSMSSTCAFFTYQPEVPEELNQ
jgi:cyclic lactone autoinducer peptide